MISVRQQKWRRPRRTWSSSSNNNESEAPRSWVRGWHSTPTTPALHDTLSAPSHDSSLLKAAVKKEPDLSREDATLLATFPTFHGISVASGSPAIVRRAARPTTPLPLHDTSDSQDSSCSQDFIVSPDLSGTHGSDGSRDSNGSRISSRIQDSSICQDSDNSDSEISLTSSDISGIIGSVGEHYDTSTHMSSLALATSSNYTSAEENRGGDREDFVPEGENDTIFKPIEKSEEEEKDGGGRRREPMRRKVAVVGTADDFSPPVARNSPVAQWRKAFETEESGIVLGFMEEGIAMGGKCSVSGGGRRGCNVGENGGRKRERQLIERGSVPEKGNDTGDTEEYSSEGNDLGKEDDTEGKEGKLKGGCRMSPESSARTRRRRKGSLTCRKKSIPGVDGEEVAVVRRNHWDSGRVRAARPNRRGRAAKRLCSEEVSDQNAKPAGGHSDASTRILVNLIQELEVDMNCEVNVSDESLVGAGDRERLVAATGMCFNVTHHHRGCPSTIDHFNLDSSVWRSKDTPSPSDFLSELTLALDQRLRWSGAAQLPPLRSQYCLQPGQQFWKLVRATGIASPLADPRYQLLAPILVAHPSIYLFSLDLVTPTPEVDVSWPEPRWPLTTEDQVKGGEGLPAWLQQALHILPPGVHYTMMDSSTCLELALEGERLCKAGDCRAGVAFFEAAIQTGTDDLRTLSAIYSQLGNAYFYLGEYDKAMDYHKLDLTVARTMGDRLGVAKASGNLGNTLKVMGKFKEAICCCERHLSISQELQDKVGEGRALYNLGNVYHAQGKHLGRIGPQEPGGFSDEVKHCLQKAVEYYAANLRLMEELSDRSAQGRACGNLGNTHYLLGNFTQAINYHSERLAIAKEFGDKAAERRAHSNLGNAHIFLGEFETAAEHYKKTLQLAQELGDRAVEAQACYSLGNTYTLLRDYPTAIHYHLRHLAIAEELADKVGEGRACWSLGNAYSATNNNDRALHYATRHLHISKEIGDKTGQAAAQMNLSDIRKVLGLPPTPLDSDSLDDAKSRTRRKSMENMDLLKMTPDAKGVLRKYQSEDAGIGSLSSDDSHPVNGPTSYTSSSHADINKSVNEESSMDDDSFFELLSRFQSKRMDDQRCTLSLDNHKESNNTQLEHKPQPQPPQHREPAGSLSSTGSTNGTSTPSDSGANQCGVLEELMESIAGMQSRRMDEQRASLPQLPGLNNQHALLQRLSVAAADTTPLPDDNFFDMLMRCQGSRIEDQRSSLPNEEESLTQSAPTVPDDDFFSLIMRFQSGRLEDQRSTMPPDALSSRPTHQENPPTPAQPATPPQSTTSTKDGLVSRLVKSRK